MRRLIAFAAAAAALAAVAQPLAQAQNSPSYAAIEADARRVGIPYDATDPLDHALAIQIRNVGAAAIHGAELHIRLWGRAERAGDRYGDRDCRRGKALCALWCDVALVSDDPNRWEWRTTADGPIVLAAETLRPGDLFALVIYTGGSDRRVAIEVRDGAGAAVFDQTIRLLRLYEDTPLPELAYGKVVENCVHGR